MKQRTKILSLTKGLRRGIYHVNGIHYHHDNSLGGRYLSTMYTNNSDRKSSWSRKVGIIAPSTVISWPQGLYEPKRTFLSDSKTINFISSRPKKDLTDLAIEEGIKLRLLEYVYYLKNPKSYEEEGLKSPKGFILSGPPGVGKTCLAEAVAGHAGVDFFEISGSDFKSPYVGQAESKMEELFKTALKNAPCVVCINEIDGCGAKRLADEKSASEHSYNATVNKLLTLLEKANPGVIIVGTTNYSEKLDPAFVRAGRFDELIQISMPGLKARAEILRVCLKGKKVGHDVSIDDLSQLSVGSSGAEIAKWVNDAAKIAVRANSKVITEEHFNKAYKIMHGASAKKQEIDDPIERKWTAIHEAGHALIGHLLNLRVYNIDISCGGHAYGGATIVLDDSLNRRRSQEEILNAICLSLAGRAAEMVYKSKREGAGSDIKQAIKLAKHLVQEGMGSTITGVSLSDVEFYINEQLKRAIRLLEEPNNKLILERLINALIIHGELTRNEFLGVLESKEIKKQVQNEKAKAQLFLPLLKGDKVVSSKGFFVVDEKKPLRGEKEEDWLSVATLSLLKRDVKLEKEDIKAYIQKISNAFGIEAQQFSTIDTTFTFLNTHWIVFKSTYKDVDFLNSISKVLKEHDIKNRVLPYGVDRLCMMIPQYEWENFIEYVMKNQPDVSEKNHTNGPNQ